MVLLSSFSSPPVQIVSEGGREEAEGEGEESNEEKEKKVEEENVELQLMSPSFQSKSSTAMSPVCPEPTLAVRMS